MEFPGPQSPDPWLSLPEDTVASYTPCICSLPRLPCLHKLGTSPSPGFKGSFGAGMSQAPAGPTWSDRACLLDEQMAHSKSRTNTLVLVLTAL